MLLSIIIAVALVGLNSAVLVFFPPGFYKFINLIAVILLSISAAGDWKIFSGRSS